MSPADSPAQASERLAAPQVNSAGELLEELLRAFFENGWGSLSKRDLELLLFLLLEKDGALERNASNYDLARRLRLTEGRVALLRRDAYARWRFLLPETTATILRRILRASLAANQLETTMKFATARRMKDGFIPLLVEHPDDRAELERAIKEAQGIPIYERNREVVLIHHETLFAIAEKHQLLPQNLQEIQGNLKAAPAAIQQEKEQNCLAMARRDSLDPEATKRELQRCQQEVKRILDADTSFSEFLKTDISKLTWPAARAAMNDLGCIVSEHALKITLTKLLQGMLLG